MKHLSLLAMSISCLVLFSFKSLHAPAPAAGEKVALVSIYCSKQVDMSEFGGKASMITQLANSEDFNLQPFVEELHKRITSSYLENLDYDFVPESEVLTTEGYDESLTDGALIKAEWLNKPEGYVGVHNQSKKTQKNTLAVFPDVDGIMIIGVDYKLKKMAQVAGFGTAKVEATVILKIVDRSAKKMFRVAVSQLSDDKLKFALGGAFDTAKLMPLVKDATEKALTKMDEKIVKKQSK